MKTNNLKQGRRNIATKYLIQFGIKRKRKKRIESFKSKGTIM